MADYWKSNPRKFCDICKCWMADNKISITNHESGLRHKSNVEKKMNELQRNNMNSEKEKQKLQDSLQKINDSAFVGMMKDIARDPSLAKRYGVVLTEEQESAYKREHELESKDRSSTSNKKPQLTTACEWREATAPDGRKYYWNTMTRETRWTQPEGVFIGPELVSVKEEKNRLHQFVLNRLVELSECGSDEATVAVHKAFNAPAPDVSSGNPQLSGPVHPKQSESQKDSDVPRLKMPKVDLLGQWVPVEDSPPTKQLKLDLPGENKSKSIPDPNDDGDSRTSVLAHLEETTYSDLHGSSRLEVGEKQLAPGSLSNSNRNVPRLVFRKGNNSLMTRNFRTASTDD